MNTKKPTNRRTTKTRPPKGQGGGYKLGPRTIKPIAADAVWMTSIQLRNRYGGRSHMWLVRKLKINPKTGKQNDPDFPRPSYDGRQQLFSVKEFEKYDRLLLSKRSG